MEQILVHYIVGLPGNVQFEREDLCLGIGNVAGWLVDISDPIRVDLVAEQVAIFVIAIEPKVGRREVLVVDEFTLDL